MTRVGARFHVGSNVEKQSLLPFIETNWCHDEVAGASAQFRFSSWQNWQSYRLEDDTPTDRFEMKANFTGYLNKSLLLQAHVDTQVGSNHYRRYKGQFGISYRW